MSFSKGNDPEGKSGVLVVGVSHRTCSALLFLEMGPEFLPQGFIPRLQSVLCCPSSEPSCLLECVAASHIRLCL